MQKVSLYLIENIPHYGKVSLYLTENIPHYRKVSLYLIENIPHYGKVSTYPFENIPHYAEVSLKPPAHLANAKNAAARASVDGIVKKVVGKLQDGFHRGLLHLHAHLAVEAEGGGVSFPYVEGDVVATDGFCIVADVLIQGGGNVFAARLLIYADVVNVQRLDVLQQLVALHLRNYAEGMAQYLAVVEYEDGFALVVEQCFQFLFVIFCRVGFE